MISTFFTTVFSVERLVESGGKSSYTSTGVSGKGKLSQASDQLTNLNNVQFGELWELFTDGSVDILPADRIAVGSDKYEVKGVKIEELASISGKRVLLVKKKL